MRTIVKVGLLAGVLLGLSTPAIATDARQALRLCEANPNCNWNLDEGGGVTLVVDDKMISCPKTGECVCICGKQASPLGITGVLAPKGNLAEP